MNTTQQVGGAVGLAVAATLFTQRFESRLAEAGDIIAGPAGNPAVAEAMVAGFSLAYWVLAVIAFAGVVLTLVLLRGVRAAEEPAPEHVETHVVSPFCFNRAATRVVLNPGAGTSAPARGS
jgi:hypothetical protein